MKQPHEDVSGIDRSGDDLLSLDMRAVAHRTALAAMATHLHSAVSVGNPAPAVARMSERLRHPQIGDFVLEWMVGLTPRRDLDSRIKAMGYLIEKRREWWTTDEEWQRHLAEELACRREYDPDAELDEDDLERSTEEAWYIQYGPDPGDICRWTNCSFIVVPIDPAEFSNSVGTRNSDGSVTITRDALLADLADSGFQFRLPEMTP